MGVIVAATPDKRREDMADAAQAEEVKGPGVSRQDLLELVGYLKDDVYELQRTVLREQQTTRAAVLSKALAEARATTVARKLAVAEEEMQEMRAKTLGHDRMNTEAQLRQELHKTQNQLMNAQADLNSSRESNKALRAQLRVLQECSDTMPISHGPPQTVATATIPTPASVVKPLPFHLRWVAAWRAWKEKEEAEIPRFPKHLLDGRALHSPPHRPDVLFIFIFVVIGLIYYEVFLY